MNTAKSLLEQLSIRNLLKAETEVDLVVDGLAQENLLSFVFVLLPELLDALSGTFRQLIVFHNFNPSAIALIRLFFLS